MIDPTEAEEKAIEHAGEMAGQYIESLGSTDIMAMSREEYVTLVECIVTAFTDRLRELEVASVSRNDDV